MVTGLAVTSVGAAFDPTTQPTRGSFWAFLFIAIALVILLFSMVRHLRRAEQLPSTRAHFEGFPEAVPQDQAPEGTPVDRTATDGSAAANSNDQNGADRH